MEKINVSNNFIEGYAKEKLNQMLNRTETSWFTKETEGRKYFKGNRDLYDHNMNKIKQKDFEKMFEKTIEKIIYWELLTIKNKLEQDKKNIEELIIKNKETHTLNRNLKRIPSLKEQKYMNKYYIYKGGIHQIVRIKLGVNATTILISTPSGKLTSKTIPNEIFQKRILFKEYDSAVKYLVTEWYLDNKIPAYRENYIKNLNDKYNIEKNKEK